MSKISVQLEKLSVDVESIKKKQDQIAHFLLDKKVVSVINATVDFESKFNIQLPINDLQTFMKFDEELKANILLKNDVVSFSTDTFQTFIYAYTQYTYFISFSFLVCHLRKPCA